MNGSGPVGIVGVGQLGLCFVQRLRSAGLDVHAYDVNAVALDRAKDAGAVTQTSPAAVAHDCAVVLVCVTGPDEVRECALGRDGLQDALKADALVIDTSTSLPATTREVANLLAARGAKFIDAPVSRGVPAALAGTLSIMVGADDAETVERALPILNLLGSDIVKVGGLGDGHAVKLLNMMLMGAHLVGNAEALGLAASRGADAHAMIDFLNRSAGVSYMTSNHLPRFALSGSYSSGFSLKLMVKDLGLGRRLADALSIPMPLADRVWHAYTSTLRQLGDVDNMRLVPYLAALAAGRSPEQARTDARSGQLPNPPKSIRAAPPSDVVATVAASNAVAAGEALRIATASGLSISTAFSVIDMSSGSSQFTAELTTSSFSTPEPSVTGNVVSASDGAWAPVLGWAGTLADIAARWSCSSAADAAETLLSSERNAI